MTGADKAAAAMAAAGTAGVAGVADGQITIPVAVGIFLAGVGWGLIKLVSELTARATRIEASAEEHQRSLARVEVDVRELRAEATKDRERLTRVETAAESEA